MQIIFIESVNEYFNAFAAIFFVFGIFLGSFVNVVIYRLPLKIINHSRVSIVSSPSRCENCLTPLKWWHNIPLISYVLLQGRCGFCGVKFSPLNIAGELLVGLVWLSCFLFFDNILSSVVWAIYLTILYTILIINYHHHITPPVLSLMLLFFGLAFSYLNLINISFIESLTSSASAYFILLLAAFSSSKFFSNTSIIGEGDPKLLAACCSWFGLYAILFVLIFSLIIYSFLLFIFYNFAKSEMGDQFIKANQKPPLKKFLPFGSVVIVGSLLFFANTVFAHPSNDGYSFLISHQARFNESTFVATNNGHSYISVQLQVRGSNLESGPSFSNVYVVPPLSELNLISFGPSDPSQPFAIEFRYRYSFGKFGVSLSSNAVSLPFGRGVRSLVSQAPGGKLFTHLNPEDYNAIDFVLNDGDPILTVLPGVVIEVIDGFPDGGPHIKYANKTNLVRVAHDDGSITTYAHLDQSAAVVRVGQRVSALEVIGFAGNSGYSYGTHLHFCRSTPVLVSSILTDFCQPTMFKTSSRSSFTAQQGSVVFND